MRKGFCLLLAGAILAVSSIPLLPVDGSSNAQAANYCPLSHMNSHINCHMGSHMKMASMDRATHMMTPAMRHCRIECCGRHDVDGLPHLLAPHALSLADFDVGQIMMDVADVNIPVLKPRLLPFPVPPPRTS